MHHDIFQTIVRVISVNTLILWCDEKNKLIENEKVDYNELYNVAAQDIFEMKRLREYSKNKKCKRTRILKANKIKSK